MDINFQIRYFHFFFNVNFIKYTTNHFAVIQGSEWRGAHYRVILPKPSHNQLSN